MGLAPGVDAMFALGAPDPGSGLAPGAATEWPLPNQTDARR